MGISGLLPLLKSIHRPCHLRKFAGQTVGVDVYGWLHRGVFACARDLVLGKPTTKFADYAMHRVRMLQHFGVVPFLVFDGDALPGKAATETARAQRREQSKQRGLELLRLGRSSQAEAEFQKAVDVTPEMAAVLIEELKRTGVQYIVAPYEADSQLVYLERTGTISAILSEDSDLLVFGAKCLLTKLDQYGACVEINRADFAACTEINMFGWTDAEFRRMAILSGCDYLDSVVNIGLKTAYEYVRKYKSLERIVQAMHMNARFRVPEGYLAALQQAEKTFLYQRVFCPALKQLVMHTVPDRELNEDELPSIGKNIEPHIAAAVARGELHPVTKEVLEVKTSIASSQMRHGKTPVSVKKGVAVDSEDLKRGVTLEALFKRQRMPLAELDINNFMPSASQERLREQHTNTTWTGQNAPPQPTSALSRSTLGSAPSVSRPLKRARLCAEMNPENTGIEPADDSSAKSPFFAAAGRRSKQSDFSIFSDEDPHSVIASFSNGHVSTQKKAGSRLQVFRDPQTPTRPADAKQPSGELDAPHTREDSTSAKQQATTDLLNRSTQPIVSKRKASGEYMSGRPNIRDENAIIPKQQLAQDKVRTLQQKQGLSGIAKPRDSRVGKTEEKAVHLAAKGLQSEELANGSKKDQKEEVKKAVQATGQARSDVTAHSTTATRRNNLIHKPKGISSFTRQAGTVKPSNSRLDAASNVHGESLSGRKQEERKGPAVSGEKERKRLETKPVGGGGKRGIVDLKAVVASFVCTTERGSEDLMVPDSEADEEGMVGTDECDEDKKEELWPIDEEQHDVGGDDFATHLSQFNWGV